MNIYLKNQIHGLTAADSTKNFAIECSPLFPGTNPTCALDIWDTVVWSVNALINLGFSNNFVPSKAGGGLRGRKSRNEKLFQRRILELGVTVALFTLSRQGLWLPVKRFTAMLANPEPAPCIRGKGFLWSDARGALEQPITWEKFLIVSTPQNLGVL
jgi:hypothetical protein